MEYEKGKWYWFEGVRGDKWIARCNSWDSESMHNYEHYMMSGYGHKLGNSDDIENCKGLATPSQIEQCLKAYAKKNGYLGKKVIDQHGGPSLVDGELKYSLEDDYLITSKYIVIYRQGKWAEIVQEQKEEPPILKELNYPRNHAIEFHAWAEEFKALNIRREYSTEELYEQFIKSKNT